MLCDVRSNSFALVDTHFLTVSFPGVVVVACFFHFTQSMARAIAKRFGRNRENWPPGLFATLKRLTVTDPTLLASTLDSAEHSFISSATTEAEGELNCVCCSDLCCS